jgi:hypothetical protein
MSRVAVQRPRLAARLSREVLDAMIVQRWGQSLETSVIKL